MIVAGLEAAEEVFITLDPHQQIEAFVADGEEVEAGKVIGAHERLRGSAVGGRARRAKSAPASFGCGDTHARVRQGGRRHEGEDCGHA